MAPNVQNLGNFKKQLTTLPPDALNLPRQSTYKDTIKLQHISTGQYANTSFVYNIKVQGKHYELEPATVTENQTVTIVWDMPIQTDKEIKANRPNIVVKDKKERTCLFIDMSIPTERNTSLKTMEKLTKYKDLEIEMEENVGNENNNCTSDHWSFWACQEGNRKLHLQDSRQYRNKRATEDRAPWNCSHN